MADMIQLMEQIEQTSVRKTSPDGFNWPASIAGARRVAQEVLKALETAERLPTSIDAGGGGSVLFDFLPDVTSFLMIYDTHVIVVLEKGYDCRIEEFESDTEGIEQSVRLFTEFVSNKELSDE